MIALFNCHFGKLPSYLPFFMKSASTVACLDIYIMTNDDFSPYAKIAEDYGFDNINFIHYDVNNLEETVSTKLNVTYKMPEIRKICDWKTAYNFLFSDIAKHYDYWGHCDLDIIMGDVDSYLEPLIGSYDIISGDKNRLCGPFNLYKTQLGDVFKLHDFWQQIMLDMKHVAYDEKGLDIAVKSHPEISTCYGVSDGRVMQNYGSPHLAPPVRIPATWSDGKLTIDEDGRETMIIHMGHKNEIVNTGFKNGNFRINQKGFSQISR